MLARTMSIGPASIAVVIPTSNRADALARALASVYAQTLLPAEIIVVDDASRSPVTTDVFSSAPDGINCMLLRNEDSKGAQFSRNRGLRASTTQFVAFLDDDDEFEPAKLEVLSNAFDQESHVLYHPALMVYDDQNFSYASSPASPISLDDLLISNGIGGTSMVCVHRESFLSIGGFDERMPALQDYEAWLRCAKGGLKFKYVDEPLTKYHHVTSVSSISKSLAKVDEAFALIAELYRDEYARLNARDSKRREERIVFTRAQRMLMSGAKVRAASYCLREGIRLRSIKVAAGMLPALVGLKLTMKLKRQLRL